MSLDIVGILDGIVSHAMASGLFELVNTHEPVSTPGNGLTCAVWADTVDPVALASGLAATSARIAFMVRIYTSADAQPLDAIDPNILAAVSVLFAAYSADFELGGTVKQIDLLGQHGAALSAKAGYVRMDNAKTLRTMTIVLPVIVNDVWGQSP